MAYAARDVSWDASDDRIASAGWLGILWLGILVGYGTDPPAFTREQPSATAIVYLHAAVFLGWLGLVTVQVVAMLCGRYVLEENELLAGITTSR